MTRKPQTTRRHLDYRCVRGIVRQTKGSVMTVEVAQDTDEKTLSLDCSDSKFADLFSLLHEGSQVNLIDVTAQPDSNLRQVRQVIVQPDFLIDISSLAACFTPYGHSPLVYTVNRLKPQANSQAILIGNFAGSALDDIINRGDDYDWLETFKTNFREKALEYCTCEDLNRREPFHQEAQLQARNIRQAVDMLFQSAYDRRKAILEPSFVCEQMGLQGRIDLMTTDLRLLVEQKSGKNYAIDRGNPMAHGTMLTEPHYVQLLLYYECLSRNFALPYNSIDGRLLYSRYGMPAGLPEPPTTASSSTRPSTCATRLWRRRSVWHAREASPPSSGSCSRSHCAPGPSTRTSGTTGSIRSCALSPCPCTTWTRSPTAISATWPTLSTASS